EGVARVDAGGELAAGEELLEDGELFRRRVVVDGGDAELAELTERGAGLGEALLHGLGRDDGPDAVGGGGGEAAGGPASLALDAGPRAGHACELQGPPVREVDGAVPAVQEHGRVRRDRVDHGAVRPELGGGRGSALLAAGGAEGPGLV